MNLTKEQKIKNFIHTKYRDSNYNQYITELLSICKEGLIVNYMKYHSDIAFFKFEGVMKAVDTMFARMIQDGILFLDDHETLHVLVWNISVLENLKTKHKYETTRKYDLVIVGQQSINDQFESNWNKTRIYRYPDTRMDTRHINTKRVIEGIKVPYYFEKILTGMPLTREEISNLNPAVIEIEERKRDLSKETIRYLCGLMGTCNGNGIIFDFCQNSIIEHMKNLIFDFETCAESTFRLVHQTLLDVGLIKEYTHPKTGRTCLKICGYMDGFKSGYIVISYMVFEYLFKKLTRASFRLAFYFLFRLNNGENGRGKDDKGANKAVYFKAELTPKDDLKTRNKYKQNLRWLHKRCTSEMRKVVQGDKETDALLAFFQVYLEESGRATIRIRSQYYVSKRITRLRSTMDALEKFKKKAEFIKRFLVQHCTFAWDDDDLRSFTQLLHKERYNVIKRLLIILQLLQEAKSKNKGAPIEKFGAYLCFLYAQYKQQENAELYNNPSEYIENYYHRLNREIEQDDYLMDYETA